MNYKFCSVFKYKNKLYICDEKYVDGPRTIVWPPKELSSDIAPSKLFSEVQESLGKYSDANCKLSPVEWEQLNKKLLDFFGCSSISAFERSKKEVSVRLETKAKKISLFGPKNKYLEFEETESGNIGKAIIKIIK